MSTWARQQNRSYQNFFRSIQWVHLLKVAGAIWLHPLLRQLSFVMGCRKSSPPSLPIAFCSCQISLPKSAMKVSDEGPIFGDKSLHGDFFFLLCYKLHSIEHPFRLWRPLLGLQNSSKVFHSCILLLIIVIRIYAALSNEI